MAEEMDLDEHIHDDPILRPFLDKRKDPFMDRTKSTFKQHNSMPLKQGSSGRDKVLNQRRFGSQVHPNISPSSNLQGELTSLNLGSPRPNTPHRVIGFSDYNSNTTPMRSHSVSSPNQEGSPMEVDSGSPELINNQQSNNIFTTAKLWTKSMKFGPSPKTSNVAPNPYAVEQKKPTIDLTCYDDSYDEDEDVLRLKTAPGSSKFEEKDVTYLKTELGPSRISDRPNISTAVKTTVITTDKLSVGRSKCMYLKYICYCQVFVVFLIAIGLGMLHVVNVYKTKTCELNQQLNNSAIAHSLQEHVYGQHIALEMVVKALDQLMISQRTMVLSFHGWTGIGKTFVSSIIVNHLRTPSVHRVVIPLHFSHSDDDDVYEARIYDWIRSNITACAVNVFIVDEMDKATRGVSLGLASVLADIRNMELNNARVLVILISNTGGAAINRYAFRHLESGYSRDQLLGPGLAAAILSDVETDWLQVLDSKRVIDHIVPFLPLERHHVRLCVEAYIAASPHYSLSHVDIEQILDDVTYLPKDFPIFSKSGCRQVNTKVDLAVADADHSDEGKIEL